VVKGIELRNFRGLLRTKLGSLDINKSIKQQKIREYKRQKDEKKTKTHKRNVESQHQLN